MGLDKANIFKLKASELKKYKEDPFLDCFESTKEFAKALKHDIDTKETPHSLLLSADFGMGKTFFSTRFTQFLRNNRYDVIYFSVWENDYFADPFLAFSKVIVNYIHNKFKAEKYKGQLESLFETTEKVVSSLTLNLGVVSVDSKELINNFKGVDPIVDFRKKLTAFISKIPRKKLIIIVDELDRCRPDYAMKVLECIKHFFDIEGLLVIIPTNKNALDKGIKALYNLEDCGSKPCESYSQKFFNDERTIKKPTQEDYLFIINKYLTQERLKEALDKHLLSSSENAFNSYQNLKNYFAQYSYKAGLTIRELKDFSLELARNCNNFYEPIRTEWLACVFAYKNKKQKVTDFVYPVSSEHCLHVARYHTVGNSTNGKNKLFELNGYISSFNKLEPINTRHFKYEYSIESTYRETINKIKTIQKKFMNYLDVEQFFEGVLLELKTLEHLVDRFPEAIQNINIIKDGIEQQKVLIEQYKAKYGSDDNDTDRGEKYIQIVESPEILYTVTS